MSRDDQIDTPGGAANGYEFPGWSSASYPGASPPANSDAENAPAVGPVEAAHGNLFGGGNGGGNGAATPAAGASPATDGYGPSSIKFALGTDGKYHAYGTRQVISSDPNKPGFSKYTEETVDLGTTDNMAGISTASGIPEALLHVLYNEQSKQINQQGNGQLRNKNPDGTYSVTMPDGTIQNLSLQGLAGIPGIGAGDIAQADKDFVYSAMRAKEATWMAGGVQLYNGGTGPGASAPTMGTQTTAPPPVAPPDMRGGGAPAAIAPNSVPPAHADLSPQAGGMAQTQAQTQGVPVASSMLPMQSAMGSSPAATPTRGGGQIASTQADPVGNYGNTNGSNQDYELGTQGLQDQYNRGNMTYNLGTSSYTNPGESRQQYSQRINDLQNQYNMAQSTFNLSHQAQAQANTGQEQAVQANKNAQMGQSRTISGMGLGSLPQARIAGLS